LSILNEQAQHKKRKLCIAMFSFPEKIYADKKNLVVLLAFLFITNMIDAQPAPLDQAGADSLHHIIESNTQDSNTVHAFYWLSRGTTLSNTNKSVEFANKVLT
jgi:hypothetical protein